jgi:hypothetical protein
MKTIDVEIAGVTPLLQNRFHVADQAAGGLPTRPVNLTNDTPRGEAEKSSYRKADGTMWHPGAAIARLLREAGSAHKQKGTRKSIKYIVPAAAIVMDDAVPLFNNKGEPLNDFEVDSRPVVIPATKGRIMRHRPRHDEWRARFRLLLNEDVLPEDVIHMLLTEGGQRIGIGDYRPEKGGPFGTFRVTPWTEVTT